MTGFKVGAASEEITPPPGVRLSGFAGRPSGNTGVRDPLRASAAFFDDGSQAAVILALDLIGLSPEMDARLRAAVAQETGVDEDAVLAACSHTHSGPATMDLRATGDMEQEWTEIVLERAQAAALAARHQSVDAELVRASGCCFANINRRRPTEKGISLAPYPPGPCDPTCRILVARDPGDQKPIAALIHYEMHPVSLGGGNLKVSADWVGHTRDRVEAALGCPVLFLQGCCGDINPRGRGEEACEAGGLDLAGSVLSSLEGLQPVSSARIAFGSATAFIPVKPLPGETELDRVEAAAQERLDRFKDLPDHLSALHLAEADVQWAAACRTLHARGNVPSSLPGRVSALTLGDVVLVGLPGEIFSSIGDRVRTSIPNAWSVGYANGNLGYLYPDEAVAEGGYEVDVAYRLYGERQADVGTADALVQAAMQVWSASS